MDPHAGIQAHLVVLLAVVPIPQSKKERERWVGEKNFDSHGNVSILFDPSVESDF